MAKGLTTGHITGFDINETFIKFGEEKVKELGQDKNIKFEVADGYNLHYPNNYFDAVTNYTYLGVLSDKKTGLNEMIRVCKEDGIVSCVIATNTLPRISYQGSYPFEGAELLQHLAEKEWKIFNNIQKTKNIGQLSELTLYENSGLKEIHIYPFSHLICYSDTYFALEYRKVIALDETTDEINWLKNRYASEEKEYIEQGFTNEDFNTLMGLLEKKFNYLNNHFETDRSYEWHGGYNFIITGIKK